MTQKKEYSQTIYVVKVWQEYFDRWSRGAGYYSLKIALKQQQIIEYNLGVPARIEAAKNFVPNIGID